MPKRTGQARWEGKLKSGSGVIKFGKGTFEKPYSAASRFENGDGTNPEELIAGAHAGCFSMALALILEQTGYSPTDIHTQAEVLIEKTDDGFGITEIVLSTVATVPEIDEDEFQKQAQTAKINCPVSKALAGTSIQLKAQLKR